MGYKELLDQLGTPPQSINPRTSALDSYDYDYDTVPCPIERATTHQNQAIGCEIGGAVGTGNVIFGSLYGVG